MHTSVLRILIAITLAFTVLSCQNGTENSLEEITAESGNVQIRLFGANSIDDDLSGGLDKQSSSAKTVALTAEAPQKFAVAMDNGVTMTAELSSESAGKKTGNAINSKVGSQVAAATAITQPLAVGTRYRVVAYNSAGTKVDGKNYTYGSEATTGNFKLNGGETYTFIAVSTNSTSVNPIIANEGTLSTARASVTATQISDLMYFKKVLTLSGNGMNYLDVILTHQLSKITTTVKMSANSAAAGARIKRIATPIINPQHQSASLNLSTGIITYGAVLPTGVAVTFPSIAVAGVSTITAATTNITAPFTDGTASFSMNNLVLTTGGSERFDIAQAVNIPNLTIYPGRRYNLNLTYSTPCTQITGQAQDFVNNLKPPTAAQEGTDISVEQTYNGSNFGFIYDIYTLDNSFNMQINGAPIATSELQFEGNQTRFAKNIEFTDGTTWGGSVPAIFDLIGNKAQNKPILRIVIDPNGNVSMLGAKVNASNAAYQLIPLRLTAGTSFNTVSWNTATTNVVKISQFVVGPTTIDATGRAFNRITCP